MLTERKRVVFFQILKDHTWHIAHLFGVIALFPNISSFELIVGFQLPSWRIMAMTWIRGGHIHGDRFRPRKQDRVRVVINGERFPPVTNHVS